MTPELAAKYELNDDIIKEVKNGNLRFVHETGDPAFPELVFDIPALNERKSAAYLHWSQADRNKWALGGLRFYVQREHDGGGSDDLFSPESDDHEANVDAFIAWLHAELEN